MNRLLTVTLNRRDFLKVSAGAVAGLAAQGFRPVHTQVRFGLVTDSHYADADPVGSRFYRESLMKMREAVTALRAENVSFLGILGDIKDMAPKEPEARTLQHLAAIEAEIQRFGGPTYHVLGNHDMDNISKPQMLAGITNTGIARDRSYYGFSHQGLRIIVLDACYLKNGQPYDHGNFDYRDTWVPDHELEWLDSQLISSLEPVMVLAHQRLDGEGALHVKNSAVVRGLLERSKKVLAVFMGHDHPGAYNQVNGIHYYTQKAVVEGSGEAQNAYSIVTVDQGLNIIVTGYRTAVSKDLPRHQRR